MNQADGDESHSANSSDVKKPWSQGVSVLQRMTKTNQMSLKASIISDCACYGGRSKAQGEIGVLVAQFMGDGWRAFPGR